MNTCWHIQQASKDLPWIGARYTDGNRIVCGGCLPRDKSGRVRRQWRRVA